MTTGPIFPERCEYGHSPCARADHREPASSRGFAAPGRFSCSETLINFHDVKSVFRLVANSEFLRLYRMLFGRRETRVRDAWSHLANPESGMWEVPAVQARWRRIVTGNDWIGFYDHFFSKYMNGQNPRVLSLACGPGETEIRIAKSGNVRRIDGYDISRERIDFATARSRRVLSGRSRFST